MKTFGSPDAVDPARLRALPPAMRREGALMLLDMGLSEANARQRLGLSAREFDHLVAVAPLPFRRGGEATLAGDCA